VSADEARAAEERRLIGRIKGVRTKLEALPSAAWAKEASNRKRLRLASQLHNLEAALIALRQVPLFPKNQRQKG